MQEERRKGGIVIKKYVTNNYLIIESVDSISRDERDAL